MRKPNLIVFLTDQQRADTIVGEGIEEFMRRTCASLLQNRSFLSAPMLPTLSAFLRERHY